MTSYLDLQVVSGSTSPRVVSCIDCAWADWWPSVGSIALRQSVASMPISAQLRPNRMIVLVMKRVDRLCLGQLLAFGTADCFGAIGRMPAQLDPAAAQSVHPCLESLLPLGLAYPGTNPPTVAPKAVKVPRSL